MCCSGRRLQFIRKFPHGDPRELSWVQGTGEPQVHAEATFSKDAHPGKWKKNVIPGKPFAPTSGIEGKPRRRLKISYRALIYKIQDAGLGFPDGRQYKEPQTIVSIQHSPGVDPCTNRNSLLFCIPPPVDFAIFSKSIKDKRRKNNKGELRAIFVLGAGRKEGS